MAGLHTPRRAVAEGFGGKVRVLSGPNAGPSAARNRGVQEASGTCREARARPLAVQ